MRKHSVHALVLSLFLCGLAVSNQALATVISGRVEGSCHIEAVDVCKISFASDVIHDETTSIIAAQVLANGVVASEYRNDAVNPFSGLGITGRTLGGDSFIAARWGQTYTLELFAQAADDLDFKRIAGTTGIPCPSSVP
jgi:hypothetical protein